MSNERKHDDMVYQMAISVAKSMLKNGIVNREEYNCKQSSKISQNSPESIPLCGPREGTIRHKVYQSCLC